MKAKLLVFFGIIAVGVAISLFTLTKWNKNSEPGEDMVSNNANDPTVAATTPNPDSPLTAQTPPAPADPVSNPSNPTANQTPTSPTVTQVTPPNPNMRTTTPVATTPANQPPVNMAEVPSAGKTGASPETVVSGAANTVKSKNFGNFMSVAGKEAVPEGIRQRLQSLIENPNLKLDPNRPFYEVAKTRDSVRWMMNFVPTNQNAENGESVMVDVAKVSTDEYRISRVSFPPTLHEVVAAIENPQANPGVTIDSLSVARAFSKAVLSEDFVSARKLCGSKVTDERIAGLMIALEEGNFAMRENRPLIVTFSRDTMSWILSRVNSPQHSSEFALELENDDIWKINGLTFGKVIAALAREVDGPYSPIVEDPSGGESLVVYFEFDEAGLTSRADNQLKIVANILKLDGTRKIRITGHADALGSDDYNRQLSQKRAEAIRQAIIDRGALPSQVITEGYGESRPRKPNFKEDGTDNPTGRSENRRAEVYLDF